MPGGGREGESIRYSVKARDKVKGEERMRRREKKKREAEWEGEI